MTNPISDNDLRFFEGKVRPLLIDKCWSCHGEEKQKGSLRLDSRNAMLEGGDSGPAISSGKPDTSLLIEAIRYQSLEMPPSKKLAENEIAILSDWIARGAPWPGSNASPTRTHLPFNDKDRSWWALQPIKRVIVPVSNHSVGRPSTWPRNEIDHFILQSMSAKGLQPAPDAEPSVLVRRLYFDVTGLPPTPKQVTDFLIDPSLSAFDKLVDRLLDTPEYGEHTARQWLDLVRYADSDGYRADAYREHAWRYRDYVIQAFNDDKPFDRFIQEQLAADELFPNDVEAQAGLGYLRHWVYEWNIRDAPGQWKTILEDVTDTTADVFLGLGLQCAKCHNHKFDPLLQKDYYRLQAYFAPILPVDSELAEPKALDQYRESMAKWETVTQTLRDEIATIEAPHRAVLKQTAINRFPEDVQSSVHKSLNEQTPFEKQISYLVMRQVDAEYNSLESKLSPEQKDRVLELKRQLETYKDIRPKPLPILMTVKDIGGIAPTTSSPNRPDDAILPGVPSIIDERPATVLAIENIPETTGRRAALAKWLTDPNNPLSTRVAVNRIWQSVFGCGLAPNTSDFGRLGEPPTHPDLLDYLTDRFVSEGWSAKTIRKLILKSSTYRQSSQHPNFAEFQSIDPLNRWYWRSHHRRLQAEQIRDAMLEVTGKLESTRGGPGVLSDVPRRSIYTRVMRNSPDELLNSFDLPLFFVSNASRNTTTTPIQALLLVNSEMMMGHARSLADSISEYGPLEKRLAPVWHRVFGRPATDTEMQMSIDFVNQQSIQLMEVKRSQKNAGSSVETGKLPYRDGQAVRFNLDGQKLELSVDHEDALNVSDFTLEAYFQLRSIDQGSAVRTIAGKWNGDRQTSGWGFGVTGQGSRRKPQTLVLQLVGKTASGKLQEAALFSDQRINLNTPYYSAVCVQLATNDSPGSVVFHLKDISNDDEPLLTQTLEHPITTISRNELPLTIGSLTGARSRNFDGLIDDVRFGRRSFAINELLYSTEQSLDSVLGFWRFESETGLTANNVGDRFPLRANGPAVIQLEPSKAALVDFCHALLNSNEFLYVQ